MSGGRYRIVSLNFLTDIVEDVFIHMYGDHLPKDVKVIDSHKYYDNESTAVMIESSEFDFVKSGFSAPLHPFPQDLGGDSPLTEEKTMLNITDEQINSIRNQLGSANITAVGYRLMVKPIKAGKEMESAEAEKFSALAKAGFEVKSKDQESRETKGSDVGVIVHAGPDCYESGVLKEREPWAKQGDVVIFPRYAGHSCELPPGSGDYYQFMTDDDLVGKYEGIEL